MNNINCVIVPDVHGRTFWKNIKDYNCDIIFLGDYVDPYGFEGITPESTIDNFIEIIEYAKNNPNVQLLLGNHDLEYAIGTYVCECRCDYMSYDKIRNLFLGNSDLFRFAVKRTYDNKEYLFSHAGIHPEWFIKYSECFSIDDICNMPLDKNIEKEHKCFVNALCDVGYIRGGYNNSGSMVWSDIREYYKADMNFIGYEQIVGHTYLDNNPIGNDMITCLDLQRIFLIDEKGDICENDGTKILKTVF